MITRLQCENLSISINQKLLVNKLNLDIQSGSYIFILGNNGVGKTLTLHTLAGLLKDFSGEIIVCQEKINDISKKELSRRIGLLLQIQTDAFPMTVMDSVLMGRYPYQSIWKWPNQIEKEIAHSALDYFGIRNLEHRIITSLSGGERERVALSTLMVQDPNIWLLDEPTNHLDPRHQLEVLKILDKQSENGRIIITTGHNPALAMQFAKQVLLLFGNGEWEYGSADELLEPNRLERLYQMPFEYYINEIDKQKVLLPS